MNKIHPTAIIEEGVTLGDDVEIGPYSIIHSGVTLGDHCILKAHVVLEGNTQVGSHNTFFPFSYVGAEPQDLKYKKEKTTVVIGDHNVIRECVSIHRGTQVGGGITSIGSHNLIMGYVHIGHDCHIGNHNILSNYTGLSGHVVLEDQITLGGQNGVTQFTHIGSYAYTGAGSLIDKHIPPYTTGYGNRFEVKGVNIVGLKRKGFSRESINFILEAHRIFFRIDLKEQEALRVIQESYGDSPEIQLFVDFIQKTGGVRR